MGQGRENRDRQCPFSGTNVLDLVHGATRQRKHQPTPSGARQFLEALDKSNTPNELLPNAGTLRKDEAKGAQGIETPSPPPTPRHKKRKRHKTKQSPPSIDLATWVPDRS